MIVNQPRRLALSGLREVSTASSPGFVDGLKAWQSPGDAVSAIKGSVSAGDFSNPAYLAGLAAVPVGLLVVASTMMGGRRRR
jgi:hypothetical protein